MTSPIPVSATTSSVPARHLRVGFDARKLDATGIGSYLRHLLQAFVESKEVEPVLFGNIEVLKKEFPTVEHVQFNVRSNHPLAFNALRDNEVIRTLDLFHAPHYVGVQALPVPISLTVHDCIHLTHPDKFYLPFISSPLMRNALKVSRKIISVSNATENEIIKRFPFESLGKITVIKPPLAQDESVSLTGSPTHILCVISTSKKHKGLLDLISAWKNLNSPLPLVIAGTGSKSFKKFESQNIKVLGPVTEQTLKQLVSSAGFIVIPSLSEGFGYVMAEAHRAGLYTVARPVPALLEQRCEADVFAADFSKTALKVALRKGIDQLQFGRIAAEDLRKATEIFNPARSARDTYWSYVECCS